MSHGATSAFVSSFILSPGGAKRHQSDQLRCSRVAQFKDKTVQTALVNHIAIRMSAIDDIADDDHSVESAFSAQQVCAAAAKRGIVLTDGSTGPFIRFSASWASGDCAAGAITGVTLPGRRLHIESYRAAARVPKGPLLRLSPGMLLFIAAIARGQEQGCTSVYGLAIDDDPQQHRRLLRYLEHFGGEKIRRVGDSLRDIPDRLLYGGRGTVVRGDICTMLSRGSQMICRTTHITTPLFKAQ